MGTYFYYHCVDKWGRQVIDPNNYSKDYIEAEHCWFIVKETTSYAAKYVNTLICYPDCWGASSWWGRPSERWQGEKGCEMDTIWTYQHRLEVLPLNDLWHTHTHAHTHTHTHTHAHVHAHAHTHTHTHIYIYIKFNGFICNFSIEQHHAQRQEQSSWMSPKPECKCKGIEPNRYSKYYI